MALRLKRLLWMFVIASLLIVLRTGAIPQRWNRLSWESQVTKPFFTRPPIVTTNPNPRAPLVRMIEFSTNKLVRTKVILNDGGSRLVLYESKSLERDHTLPILGLRPGRQEQISLIVTDVQNNEIEWLPIDIVTNSLPSVFPTIDVAAAPERMEPGVTVFNLTTPSVPRLSYLVAVNERGQVVWYYQSDIGIGDARRLRNGNFLLQDAAGAVEIDILGNTIRRWQPDRPAVPDLSNNPILIATDQLHHEVFEMPSGDFLSLSLEMRRFNSYPSSETDPHSPPGIANVVGDLILEYRPDGSILNRWSLFEILDPFRIGFGSLSGVWDSTYPEARTGTEDWTHANAVIYDEADNSMIVSLRHQDAVVKIDRATGRLVWILGDPAGWVFPWNRYLLRPIGDLMWPFHQHAPEITPNGTLLIFDNGNFRRFPFDDRPPQNYTRVVEYAIDSKNLTVAQVWSYGGPNDELFFSNALGDVDWLPSTGNILMTDGSRIGEGAPPSRFARIVELTHTTPAQKVFEMVLRDAPGSNLGWRVYRSERLPSLYPN